MASGRSAEPSFQQNLPPSSVVAGTGLVGPATGFASATSAIALIGSVAVLLARRRCRTACCCALIATVGSHRKRRPSENPGAPGAGSSGTTTPAGLIEAGAVADGAGVAERSALGLQPLPPGEAIWASPSGRWEPCTALLQVSEDPIMHLVRQSGAVFGVPAFSVYEVQAPTGKGRPANGPRRHTARSALFRLFRFRELAGRGCSTSEPHHCTRLGGVEFSRMACPKHNGQ